MYVPQLTRMSFERTVLTKTLTVIKHGHLAEQNGNTAVRRVEG